MRKVPSWFVTVVRTAPVSADTIGHCGTDDCAAGRVGDQADHSTVRGLCTCNGYADEQRQNG